MVMIGQINKPNYDENNNSQKIGWRGCCALVALFAVTFFSAFFIFIIWHYYRQINNIDLAAQIWNSDQIETVDRKLLETADDPFWGNADAKIIIVEFSDFECPVCKKMMPILRELNKEYPNQIKFIYRDYLNNINSQKTAEAAQCANEQEQFLTYHDKLFLNQGSLNVDNLKIYAKEIGITNIGRFNDCLDSDQFEMEVQQDYQQAIALGVQGTPTFFVNGIKVEGARPKEFFEQIIEYLQKQENNKT